MGEHFGEGPCILQGLGLSKTPRKTLTEGAVSRDELARPLIFLVVGGKGSAIHSPCVAGEAG